MDDEQVEELRGLHAEIDEHTRPLERLHAARLECRKGCSACCMDDLTVFDVEAEAIRRGASDLLERGEAGPLGACAFLDEEGGCRIYEHRPYVCRTQGLPLRWLEEREPGEPGEIVEMRDICPLNEEGPPIEELSPDACWTLGPWEERLRSIQERFAGGALTRVKLRGLFR